MAPPASKGSCMVRYRTEGQKAPAGRACSVGVALVLVVGLCCACAPTHAGRASGSSTSTSVRPDDSVRDGTVIYGLDVNPADPDIGLARVPQVLQLVQRAGASAVRIGGNWATEEPSPDHYDFAEVDQLFSLAKTDGLTVLFELGKEPAWDATGGNRNAPPSDCDTPSASCASVTQYVTALVDHAASEGLRYLVVRNEPQDFNKNWVGGDAASYAHFQDVVYKAAHAADPAIKVLNGGTEAVTPSLVQRLAPQAALDTKAIAFATALYSDPSWCDSLDVLDVHVGTFGPVWSPQIVDASERAIEACDGGRRVPVWVTEVGYPSTPALQASSVYINELGDRYRGGEIGQARFLADTFRALAHDENVIGTNWTFAVDPNSIQAPPPSANDKNVIEGGFGAGLVYSNYRSKASYRAFRLVAAAKNFAPPAGLEPAPPAPEAGALSAELRGRALPTALQRRCACRSTIVAV